MFWWAFYIIFLNIILRNFQYVRWISSVSQFFFVCCFFFCSFLTASIKFSDNFLFYFDFRGKFDNSIDKLIWRRLFSIIIRLFFIFVRRTVAVVPYATETMLQRLPMSMIPIIPYYRILSSCFNKIWSLLYFTLCHASIIII